MGFEVRTTDYTGDAQASHAISMGFSGTPQCALVIEAAGAAPAYLKQHTTADESFYSQVAGLQSDGIRSLDSGGITVGDSGDVNALGVAYVAFGLFSSDDADLAVGSYAGAGGSGQTVTTGFQPSFVWIWADNAFSTGRTWWASKGGDNSNVFFGGSGAFATGYVTGVTSTAFTTGSNLDTVGRTYYWIAIKETFGSIDNATYTGDGNDGRNITFKTITTAPIDNRIIFVKGQQGAVARGVQAPSVDEPTSYSIFTGASTGLVTVATAATTFQVNNAAQVNVSPNVYDYLAIQNTTAAVFSGESVPSPFGGGGSSGAPFQQFNTVYSFTKGVIELDQTYKQVRLL